MVAPELGWAVLWDSYDAAFEQSPWNGDVEPVMIYGHAGSELVRVADRADDLLVLGAARAAT